MLLTTALRLEYSRALSLATAYFKKKGLAPIQGREHQVISQFETEAVKAAQEAFDLDGRNTRLSTRREMARNQLITAFGMEPDEAEACLKQIALGEYSDDDY